MTIDIAEGQSDQVEIRKLDDAKQLAEHFFAKHDLPADAQQIGLVAEHIEANRRSALERYQQQTSPRQSQRDSQTPRQRPQGSPPSSGAKGPRRASSSPRRSPRSSPTRGMPKASTTRESKAEQDLVDLDLDSEVEPSPVKVNTESEREQQYNQLQAKVLKQQAKSRKRWQKAGCDRSRTSTPASQSGPRSPSARQKSRKSAPAAPAGPTVFERLYGKAAAKREKREEKAKKQAKAEAQRREVQTTGRVVPFAYVHRLTSFREYQV